MEVTPEILQLRAQINEIDQKIVSLINERAQVAMKIGDAKIRDNIEVYIPKREGEVLEAVTKANNGPLSNGDVQEIFTEIMGACRRLQITGEQLD